MCMPYLFCGTLSPAMQGRLCTLRPCLLVFCQRMEQNSNIRTSTRLYTRPWIGRLDTAVLMNKHPRNHVEVYNAVNSKPGACEPITVLKTDLKDAVQTSLLAITCVWYVCKSDGTSTGANQWKWSPCNTGQRAATHGKEHPLQHLVIIVRVGLFVKREPVLLVVVLPEIQQDGGRLQHDKAIARDERRDAPDRVQLEEPPLRLGILGELDSFHATCMPSALR
ncbi:hypothetical protein C8Q80DRAFT_575371 [Daedaleopsis nitida]|nr:hypothetical protein C8Q80DRAFT_575371 [Daedaleopsis nitida]